MAIAEWCEKHPHGTVDQLVADIGPQFHREYAVVLRGVFFAGDRDRPRQAAKTDSVVRRARFEAEHPEVQIITPPTSRDLWRAIIPAGQMPGRTLMATVTGWSLEQLMDRLEDIHAPEGGQGLPAKAPTRCSVGYWRRIASQRRR